MRIVNMNVLLAVLIILAFSTDAASNQPNAPKPARRGDDVPSKSPVKKSPNKGDTAKTAQLSVGAKKRKSKKQRNQMQKKLVSSLASAGDSTDHEVVDYNYAVVDSISQDGSPKTEKKSIVQSKDKVKKDIEEKEKDVLVPEVALQRVKYAAGSLQQYIDSTGGFDDAFSIISKSNITSVLIFLLNEQLQMHSVNVQLLIYGSFQLNCSRRNSDVDLIAVGNMNLQRAVFFESMKEILASKDFYNAFAGRIPMVLPNSKLDSCKCVLVNTAKIPIFKFEFIINQYQAQDEKFELVSYNYDLGFANLPIQYPLPFAPLASLLLNPVEQTKILKELDGSTDDSNIMQVQGLVTSYYIAGLIAKCPPFFTLLRLLKLWADRKGLYDPQIGALKGNFLNNMALFITLEHPGVGAEELAMHFFDYFAEHWTPDSEIIIRKDAEKGIHPVYAPRFPTFGPKIYRPLHRGKPLIERMPKSVALLIRHELSLARNLIASGASWEVITQKRESYAAFIAAHSNAVDNNNGNSSNNISTINSNIVTIKGVISKDIPENLLEPYASFIHSQAFKLIHMLEGTSGTFPGSKLDPALAEFFQNNIVLYEHPAVDTFIFTLLLNGSVDQKDDKWKSAIKRASTQFITEALAGGYLHQVVKKNEDKDKDLPKLQDSFILNLDQ